MGIVQRRAHDRWQRLASSPRACVAMFVWAAAEATVWPIIPEFLLVPLVGGRPRRPYDCWWAAASGMAVGGTIEYLFAYRNPERAVAVLEALPLTRASDVARVRRRLAERGAREFFLQPYSGIPMKVWAAAAAHQRMPPHKVILASVVARAIRMALFTALMHAVETKMRDWLRDHFLVVFALCEGTFFAVWGRMGRSTGDD